MTSKFNIHARLKSIRHALCGILLMTKYEHNARIHIVVAIITLATSWYLEITRTEWVLIIFTISAVIATELLNSAIESISDLVSSDYHPLIKIAKDYSAGAVLIFSISAVIIGSLIFLPRIFDTFF